MSLAKDLWLISRFKTFSFLFLASLVLQSFVYIHFKTISLFHTYVETEAKPVPKL